MAFIIEKYCFKSNSMYEGLSLKEIKMLKSGSKILEYKKNKTIFKEGEYSKGVYILNKGKVKIFQYNKDGKEQIAYLYAENEIMGYRPILCHETHPVTAVAIEDCSITFIESNTFIHVLDRSIKFSRTLHEKLAHEFNVWINTITQLTQQPAKERLALTLLILNEKYRNDPGKAPVINIFRSDLANYTRITIETLARTLAYFKEQKILRTIGRKIIILKPDKLAEIAELY